MECDGNIQLAGYVASLNTAVNDLVIVSPGGPVDISGADLTRSPKITSNISLAYYLPTDSGAFDFRMEYSTSDEQRMDYLDERITGDEFKLLDARIGWTSADEKWDVAIWGKNLGEDDYISHQYVIGPGGIGVWGAPRTFGMTVNWNL